MNRNFKGLSCIEHAPPVSRASCLTLDAIEMIRALSDEDIDAFRTIRSEALANEPDAFGETTESLRSKTEEELAERCRNLMTGRKRIIAAFEGNRPVAMCGFGISDDDETIGFLWGMYVTSSHRRKGLGRDLLMKAERWVADHGGHSMGALVAAPNKSAINFYKECGYTVSPPTGTLRDGSDVPLHSIRKETLG